MNWIKRIMYGRYGSDNLSLVLVVLSILLSILGRLTNLSFLWSLSYLPLGISIFRMFSKDINKRSMENYKFAIFMSPVYSKFKKLQRQFKNRKAYKFYTCPNCKMKLRFPKGKGKIMITCPSCKFKFQKRT